MLLLAALGEVVIRLCRAVGDVFSEIRFTDQGLCYVISPAKVQLSVEEFPANRVPAGELTPPLGDGVHDVLDGSALTRDGDVYEQ